MKKTDNRSPLKSRATVAALSAVALALALAACGKQEDAPASSTGPTAEPPATVAPAPEPVPGAADPAASNSATPGSAPAPGTAPAPNSLSEAADATRDAAQSAAVALDDTGITAKVKAELVKDSELSALSISVETNGGHVTLSGSAPNAQAKERAEGLAKGIEGVTGVANNIEVAAGG